MEFSKRRKRCHNHGGKERPPYRARCVVRQCIQADADSYNTGACREDPTIGGLSVSLEAPHKKYDKGLHTQSCRVFRLPP